MEQQELDSQQQEALEESLSRGLAFEELIRTKGWEYVKAWYQKKIQALATGLLLEDKKKIEEFENDRRELIGIRRLLGLIDNDIQILKKHEEDKRPTKK
jgi:hypothetical protein